MKLGGSNLKKPKSKTIHKDVFREIKNSVGRFVSIFLIVFLGVALYAGVRSSAPDMELSADALYDKYNMSDIKVMSSLGITGDDISAIEKVAGVEKACGSYTYDFLSKTGDSQSVVQVKSETCEINEICIEEGRGPKEKNECVINEGFQRLRGYKIGDVFTLESGDGKELADTLACDTFTVVGIFSTPEHLSDILGSSSIGSGSIDGIMIVPEETFVLEVFTEANVIAKGTKELSSYSAEYDSRVAEVVDNIEKISDAQVEKRYNDIIGDAREELDKARKEFEEGKAEFEDGKDKWEEGKRQIEDAKKQYEDGLAQVEQGWREIESKKPELEANKKLLAEKWDEFYAGEAELKAGLQEFIIQRDMAEAEIAKQEAQLAEVEAAINAIIGPRTHNIIRIIIKHITGMDAPYEEYKQYVQERIAEARAQLDAAKAQIDAGFAELEAGRAQLIDAQAQLDAGQAQLIDGQAQLIAAKAQLDSAKIEIESGEKELQDNLKELEKAEKEIKDAEKKLDDAEKELAKIEKGEWYVLDRSYLEDFAAYGDNAGRIGNIGKVFPLVFFIVAALVCLTSMTRMVEEERTQIGTLKALGYSKFMIIRKYVVYAILATVTGAIAGALVGGKALPWFIMYEFRMVYPNLKILLTPYNLQYCLIAGITAFVCIIAATVFACIKSLKEVPASLMRPIVPKATKKILLERIPALWRKIPFNWKNALRNFIRYKKRLLMTLIGICGSTAIMLVGFGLEDALGEILVTQYSDICLYDQMLNLDQNITQRNREELESALSADSRIDCYSYVYENVVEASGSNSKRVMDGYIYVPRDVSSLSDTVSLHERKGKKPLSPGEDAVIITEKMADGLNAKAGDVITVTIKQDKKKVSKDVKVSAVAENYINDYVYMSPALYEKLFNEKPETNVVEVKNKSDAQFDGAQFRKEYLEYSAVSAITSVDDILEKYGGTFGSLDTVIAVLILCAGALAFVVLYNLNNINISERRRELATLKVLGFYDIEVSQYIYRENILITLLGIPLGLIGGVFLTRYIISTVEVDVIMFGKTIYTPSFIFTALIALGFTIVVNVIVHFSLKKIDMATSLKSVE